MCNIYILIMVFFVFIGYVVNTFLKIEIIHLKTIIIIIDYNISCNLTYGKVISNR